MVYIERGSESASVGFGKEPSAEIDKEPSAGIDKEPSERIDKDSTLPKASPNGEWISGEDILRNFLELRAHLKQRSSEIEELRHIPEDIVQTLRRAGAFRMMMPRCWGGPEMNPMQVVEALEELALGNASVAWCVMIQNDSGLYSGMLEPAVARQMFPHLDVTTSNVVAPMGRACKVDGGYIINGRWQFGSGCRHADWIAAGCQILDNNKPVLDAHGAPVWRMLFARPEEFTILDTWYTTGLRGTGSHDFEACDLFVPAERSFSFFENASREGALYLWPSMFLTKMSGVVLGIARDAIETVSAILTAKKEKSERLLLAVADAQTLYDSARTYVYDSLEKIWVKLQRGELPSEQERVKIFLSRTNAFRASRKAVQLMYDALGGHAVYTHNTSLDRNLRDINTACQHLVGQRKSQQAAAALMLGVLENPVAFL